MTEKTLTTENIRPALDALRGELAPWPVVAKKQDRLNTAQLNAANSGITSSLVAQIIANTAAIRALESAITGTGLRALVVSSLPATGTQGILYIVPVTTYDPETDADVVNYSNEYIWIVAPDAPVTEGYYEQVGQTGIVINNGQLNITVNGTSVGAFTANQSGDTTAAITVPTNADYVDLSTNQTVAGDKTWTGEQSFTLPIVGSITGTASKAIADEDGTSIKSGYVNVAGNQTVTGQKTWTGSNTFNQNVTIAGQSGIWWDRKAYTAGILPASTLYYGFQNAYESGGSVFDRIRSYVSTTGTNLSEHVKYAWNDLTKYASVTLWISADGSDSEYKYNTSRVIPATNNAVSLGSSSYQWSSVYAQSYYYNGTAWGLDKANEWTTDNRFLGSNLSLQNNLKEIGSSSSAGHYTIHFKDKNSADMGYISHQTTFLRFGILNKFTNGVYDPSGTQVENYLSLNIKSDGTKSTDIISDFIPGVTNAYNLGTSTNKWKTLNGINPGALSLPSSDYVEIDTTNWDLTGATSQSYTPAVHGWLYIAIQNIAGNYLSMACSRGAVSNDGTGVQSGLKAMLPVIANGAVTITVKTGIIFAARFYPMLGNV